MAAPPVLAALPRPRPSGRLPRRAAAAAVAAGVVIAIAPSRQAAGHGFLLPSSPSALIAPQRCERSTADRPEEAANASPVGAYTLAACTLLLSGALAGRRPSAATTTASIAVATTTPQARPAAAPAARPAAGRCQSLALRALPPEAADLLGQARDWWHASGGSSDLDGVVSALHHWAEAVTIGAGHVAHGLWPPAYADDAAPVLDPNVKYVLGADGNVLFDPMNNKPITDDWWNGFIGFQANLIKEIDAKLREVGVPEAFGWTIVLYTLLVKALFYPLQQSQLRSTSMMQLLSPKAKEIQEKYKDDPETMQRLLGQLYAVMDVNPLGGCLPVILQLPIFWSLYGVWRRLAAEKFPYYTESWLWVPSLAQPNPDFQFKFDWLLQFKDGAPTMGWHDYLCYLVFPAFLVGFTIVQQQQAQAAKPKSSGSEEEQGQLILQVLPWISVYFIATLSLELPQAVSVYYSVNTLLTLAQTSFVKWNLRQEIPGYEEFEKTGKFPDGAFEDMVRASAPVPKTLHEAALRGDVKSLQMMLDGADEEGGPVEVPDINAWDEKEIAPLGYAVACGHLDSVRFFIDRGANLLVKDGQENSLLHYASGYGHKEVLEELLKAGADQWPNNEWSEWRNRKGQSVLDAARVNRKGPVIDFLCEYLGLDPTEVLPPASAPAAAAAPTTVEVAPSPPQEPSSDAQAQARAALLAAAGGSAASQPPGAAAAGASKDPAAAMRLALEQLKQNPKAVEQARQMMGKVPPQLLSMLSGNKLSTEQVQKAMDAMKDMSTEDLLARADAAANQLQPAAASSAAAAEKEAVSAGRAGGPPARAVD